ncbi:hypothetical protein HPB52_011055 [Rhipicephalus sanguineus]|uniref:C2H2-type domain-containing protein n=1 Tax=Rhipicephalus sanguineus TaxID=34632 RepID=A0A9D4SY97_RHISA|nr:hypothetical protein HPB52_011055 [Rhipicephalus sanguineus]
MWTAPSHWMTRVLPSYVLERCEPRPFDEVRRRMEAVKARLEMDHEEEEDVDDPQQDSGSGHSTESEEVTDQSSSGSPSSTGSPKHENEMGQISQDNSNTDDNTDVEEPQSEIRDGEFQFQVQSFHIVTVNARQGKKQFKCDVCTGTYQHAFSLKRHFLRTHVNYKYLSEADITNCNINLNLVRQLREESESLASGEKQFFCKHCDKSFPSLANRRRHEKIHEGSDLPFPCSFCAASFAHDVHLRKHLRNHHPECYYPCELCSKFFLEEGQLKKHRATHRAPVEGTPSKGCKPPDAHVFGRKRVKGFEPENKYLCSISKPATKEMSEEQFYMTIAHRISENLLYHLDGTSTQLNIKQDPCAFPEEKSERANVQYSIHNFPAAFDITQMMQIYSNRAPSSNQGMSNDGSDNSEETECIFLGGSQQDHIWPHKSNGVANFRSQNAEIEQAPSPIFGEGRRVLRSKTAAASNATGGASSAVVNSHTCSTCKRSFTYLASLKKHLRDICPNKKVAGQKVVKRRKAGKFSKKEGSSSETQICAEPVQDSAEVKKENSETASSCLSSSVTFPEEADTSGLELLANASSMAAPNCSGGASWSPSSCPVNQPTSTVQTKEVESKALAAPARRLRGKERADDEDVDRKPDIRPHSQEHTCPYCLHSFAYLSNYRKHLREVCLLKKKAKQNGDGSEPSLFSTKTSDESRSLVDRADGPSTVTMSFKGRIENSVINLLRNQSKQVELIGAQAAAVKDQPGGANHPSPNFMTFSCPVCHKIFLSYVKMLQHRLSHKLQTDESLVKEEKTDVPEAADAHDAETSSAADDAGQVSDGVRRADCTHSPAVKTDEDQRFDEILMRVRGSDAVVNDALQEELKREEHNYAVSLAELDSLPDEDDGEDVAEAEATKESPVEVAPSEASAETTRAAKKTGAGKKSPVSDSRAPAKDKVRRGMRRHSGRASKTACRDKQ